MKFYDLWLDESGTFRREDQDDSEKYPSLIGGILIEQGILTDNEITSYVGQERLRERSHGTTMNKRERRDVMVPALEGLCAKGGKLVYFENDEHIDFYGNRELYLRMMAGGLLRLFEKLCSEGPFSIDIIIASRMVVDSDDHGMIKHDEYISILKAYMIDGMKSETFDLDPECRINISVQDARTERRLQLADYACNSRLTRNSANYYSNQTRLRIEALYDNEYIFGIKTNRVEKRIETCLINHDIPGALLEFYLTKEKIDRKSILKSIKKYIQNIPFYPMRIMLDEFTESILRKVYRESDFENSEAILKKILDELLPIIKKINPNHQTDVTEFRLLFSLSDMYLREGDLSHAYEIITRMRDCVLSMNYHIEGLKWLYLYYDRHALFCINSLEYDKAVEMVSHSIKVIEELRDMIDLSDELKTYYNNIRPKSEYLGNAYTMKIYAEMFLQRQNKKKYTEIIRKDSDKALEEYHYTEELERNQQYRAHIEMVAGNCREAFGWLMMTKNLTSDISGADREAIKQLAVEYLNKTEHESKWGREYNLMYYVEIMLEAGLNGDTVLSDSMYDALIRQKHIYNEIIEDDAESGIMSDGRREARIYKDFLKTEIKVSRRHYHPREITLWKYGIYLFKTGKAGKNALSYLEKAFSLCMADRDYETMQVIGIAIGAQLLGQALETDANKIDFKSYAKDLNSLIKQLKKVKEFGDSIISYVDKAEKCMADYNKKIDKRPEEFIKELYELASQIAY